MPPTQKHHLNLGNITICTSKPWFTHLANTANAFFKDKAQCWKTWAKQEVIPLLLWKVYNLAGWFKSEDFKIRGVSCLKINSRIAFSSSSCNKHAFMLSHVRLFATPWTVAHQAPLSMEFSRREYWSGWPFPSPGDLPDPGIENRSPELQADSLLSEPPGKPKAPHEGILLPLFHMWETRGSESFRKSA